MPSPFPGMDPYLEGSLWTSIHTQLGAEIARQLAPKISPRYIALATERFIFEEPETIAVTTASVYPDVGVAEAEPLNGAGGVATVAPLQLATLMPEPVPHVNVEIRDVAQRRLVTAIELLSPTNKRGEGREEYLRKRLRLLSSTAHLVEIDLHRKGHRVPMQKPLPLADYFVFISRAAKRPITDIWPIGLREPLPTVPIPLLEDDSDVNLDLQAALTNVYDLLRYDLACDYSQPPEPPLSEADSSWARERIEAWRRR